MSAIASPLSPPSLPLAPGPRGWPVLGVLPRWRRDKLALIRSIQSDFGDVARMRLGVDFTVVVQPEHVKHVLQDNHLNYRKGFDFQRMSPLVGEGLLTSNGAEWKRHRRLAQPAFHRQRLTGFGALMVRHTEQLVQRWRTLGEGAEVDLHAELMGLTLSIVGEALFSADLGTVTARIGTAMSEALRLTDLRINQAIPLPLWLPTQFNRRYRQQLATLDEVVGDIIRDRRQRPPSDDLLSMLLEAREEGSNTPALSDGELRDEVMTLVLAGHETTANALAFTQLLLTQHPDVETRLRGEVERVVGRRSAGVQDVGALTYTRQVAEESMRLYPPAWFFSRQAIADDVIGGYRVPAGSMVSLAPILTHRSPQVWADPERFDPERFSPERSAQRHRFAFFPFGGGPRMCIGNAFAMMELQLVLATLQQHVRLEVLQPDQVVPQPMLTLRPRGALRARVHFR